MNIAVLGASFDPAHNGHLTIIKNVLKSQKADRIILMPVNIHPFAKKLTKASHRLKMAKMLKGKNIEVSDLELKKNSTNYSIDTLQFLQQKFPKDKIYWIIGSDHLESFTKWKDWQKIIQDFGLIVVPRQARIHLRGVAWRPLGGEPQNVIILNAKKFQPFDVSSSEIKKKIKERQSIKNLVPKGVENYIMQNKLYI